MYDQPRWPAEAGLPILAGLLWLWCAASFGLVGFVFSLVPGVLLLGSGVSLLLWPRDDRITQFMALGGLLGVPLAVPVFWVTGPWLALLLIGVSAASFVAAGVAAVRQEPHVPEVPVPELGAALAGQVAVDEALLATMNLTRTTPWGRERERILDEAARAREAFEARGWLAKPADYHRAPPPLEDPALRPGRTLGTDYELLSFESGYEPHEGEPGRERWLGYAPNRTALAHVLRARQPDRPWLLCFHGYQMGWDWMDVGAFRRLHQRHDLNLVLPVLPLHGPRKIGRRSGDGFLDGDVMNSVHAEAQAMWDARRILSWVRAQGAPAVGAYGLSLGGYNTALLASLDGELACAIAGIPATDFARLIWRHGAPLEIMVIERHGIERATVDEVLRVVSPLHLEPRVPRERRAIFAGTADRLVPPDQVHDLWVHWERPRMHWYRGAHMTFALDRRVDQLLADTLRAGGLI